MTDYDEVMPTPERSEEELIEMVKGEFSGPVTPPPANDVPEAPMEFYEEQASLYAAREAESAQDAGAFFDFDEHEAAEWTATVRNDKPTIVKTSDLTDEEKDEARRQELLAKQREKQRKKIDEALAVEAMDDPLIASLNKSNEIKPVNYVIQSLIPERSVGFLVGESGAKKTFAALQMAICVATGIDFGGLPVRQGSVMYFAPEDASGVRERYAGWKYTQNKNQPLPNFWVLSQQVPLHRESELQTFAATIKASPFFGLNPLSLIVIDTYSANSAGQKVGETLKPGKDDEPDTWIGGTDFNENDNNVAAILMRNAALLAEWLNCAVMIIHHTGKDTERGARGASTLRANAGFEIMVKKCKDKELFVIEHTKAKGCALLPPRAMRTKAAKLPPELVKMKREALARMQPVRPEAKANPAAWEIGDNLGTLTVINALEPVPTGDKDEKPAGAAEVQQRSQTEENALRLAQAVHEYNEKRGKNRKIPKMKKAALYEMFRHDMEPKLTGMKMTRAFDHATKVMGLIKMAGDETLTATSEAIPLLGGIRDQQPLPTDWKPTSGEGDLDEF